MDELDVTTKTENAEVGKDNEKPKNSPINGFEAFRSENDTTTFRIDWITGHTSEIEASISNLHSQNCFYEEVFLTVFNDYLDTGISSASQSGHIHSLVLQMFARASPPEEEWNFYIRARAKSDTRIVSAQPIIRRTVLKLLQEIATNKSFKGVSISNDISEDDILLCLNALLFKIEDAYIRELSELAALSTERGDAQWPDAYASEFASLREQIMKSLLHLETRVEIAFQIGDLEDVDRKQIFSHFTAIRDLLSAPAPNLSAIAFIIKSLDTA